MENAIFDIDVLFGNDSNVQRNVRANKLAQFSYLFWETFFRNTAVLRDGTVYIVDDTWAFYIGYTGIWFHVPKNSDTYRIIVSSGLPKKHLSIEQAKEQLSPQLKVKLNCLN